MKYQIKKKVENFNTFFNKVTFIALLSITLLMTGCNDNKDIKDEIEILKISELEDMMIDLDNDGKEEKVSYKIQNYLNSDERYSSIVINDNEHRMENFNPTPNLYITKLDIKKDGYTFLVGDEGASNDYTTQFFSYEKGNLIELGKIGGIYDENDLGVNLSINGDGTVKTKERADILQTWFYDATYELNDGKLELIDQEFYDVNHQVTTLMDYEYYKKPLQDAEKVKISKDTELKFIGIDNEKWIMFEYKNIYGEDVVAYFMVEDYFYIDKENNVMASTLFSDLVYAD